MFALPAAGRAVRPWQTGIAPGHDGRDQRTVTTERTPVSGTSPRFRGVLDLDVRADSAHTPSLHVRCIQRASSWTHRQASKATFMIALAPQHGVVPQIGRA